mgnify:CR=1 FL=1
MEEIYIGESDIDENGEKTPRVGVGLLCAGGAGGAGCAGGAGQNQGMVKAVYWRGLLLF